MKADLAGQIHELMERGVRPVTMTDIQSRAPVRMTVLQRAAVRSRLAGSRLARVPGGSPAPRLDGGPTRLPFPLHGGGPRRPRQAILAAAAATAGLAIVATVIGIAASSGPVRPAVDAGAVRLLAKVAAAAARQPAPHVHDSQYMYIQTTTAVRPGRPIELGSTPPPVPRHIHLKLVTERVW